MEAKGCAKAMVWKGARRHFYWAVRAKLARTAAMVQLADASPDSTVEYRARLLESLASIDSTTDYRVMAETLETLDLFATVAQLKADHLMRSMLALAQEDRKATMDGLVRLVDNLSEDEKATLISALQTSSRSPGAIPSLPHMRLTRLTGDVCLQARHRTLMRLHRNEG